jgi:hypothetical protein
MPDLTAALAKVEGEQATALGWFHDHAGKAVSWSMIQKHAEHGACLVTQAKGIYPTCPPPMASPPEALEKQ